MKLSKKALQAILANKSGLKLKIAIALNCSEGSINRYLRENSDDLTKAAALKVIREETGLGDDQILETEQQETKQSA